MILPEIVPPVVYPLLLISSIIVNLVLVVKYLRGKHFPVRNKTVFLLTFATLGLIVPHYSSTFKLDLTHFLEHSVLKLLFVLSAVNLGLLLRVRRLPSAHARHNRMDEAAITAAPHIDEGSKALYETFELAASNPSLSGVSTTSARFSEQLDAFSSSFSLDTFGEDVPQYIRNAVTPVEKAVNWLWNLFASSSETILNALSRIQTGLLSHNLIFVLGFVLLFGILVFLVPGG